MGNNEIKKAIVDTLDVKNSDYKYYVYALCEKKKTDDGEKLIPFYIGKGKSDRLWAHEEGEKKELAYINQNIKDDVEKENAINALPKKHKRIGSLRKDDKLEKVIIKWGMSENEAFMAESALINMFRMNGLSFDSENTPLTNVANGHHGKYEDSITKARTIDDFYKDCAQPPIDIADLNNAVLININKGYQECLNVEESYRDEAVREMVRGFWRLGSNKAPDVVFAMYQQRVVGVYKIRKEVKGKRKKKEVPVLYSVLDYERPDYPKYDNLQIRKKDLEISKLICDVFGKGNDISFNKLDEKQKEKVREFFDENSDEECNKKLNNWVKRKYYVLEDISSDDEYAKYKKYIGCRIIAYDDKRNIVSPIPPRNYIKYIE